MKARMLTPKFKSTPLTREIKNRNEQRKEYSKAKKEALELAQMIERAIVDQPATPTHYWASVSEMKYLASELEQIKDRLYGTGEYAS